MASNIKKSSSNRKNLKELIRHFTPNWFTMVMGTGILFLMIGAFPYHFPGQKHLAITLGIINVFLLAIFSIMFASRLIFFFKDARRLLDHPIQSMYLGAIPMGLATIVNGMVIFGPGLIGSFAVPTALILWYVDVIFSIVSGWLVPFYMFTSQKHSVERMTAVWLLPIVPSEVAAASAGFLAKSLPPVEAQKVIYLGYILWALSMPLAMSILVILFLRLVWHKLPHQDMAVSSWLTLGPIGTGSLSIMLLGVDSVRAFMGTQWEQVAITASHLGVIFGLLIWGYGMWWLIMAIFMTLTYIKEGLPFNMGWWGFTFPLGVFTAATIELYNLTSNLAFKITGSIFVLMLAMFWIIVTVQTLKGSWSMKLFNAPCLSEETGLPEPSASGICLIETERESDRY